MTESYERVVQTSAGPLTVGPAFEALVNFLGARWPVPIATTVPREDAHSTHNLRAEFLVPFEHEGKHVNLIYLAQAPRALAAARAAAAAIHAELDRALLAILRAGFPGLAILLSTLRVDGERGTPGLALVIGPGERSTDADPNPLQVLLDALARREIALEPFEGAKYVPPAVAGELRLGFGLLEGQVVFCFKPALDPSDPSLARLVEAGVRALTHMPVTGTAFPEFGEPLPLPQAPAPQLMEQVSPNGLRRVYRLLANMAGCDGAVDPAERAMLNGVAERFRLSAAEVATLEEEGFAGRGLRVGERPAERELLIAQLIEMALADGELDPAEIKRLRAFALKFQLPFDELNQRIQRRQAERAEAAQRPAPQPSPERPREETARVVILDVPEGTRVDLNLLQGAVIPGFLGFQHVAPGVHRFALTLPDGRRLSRWIKLAPGEVEVLTAAGEALVPAGTGTWTQTQRQALAGELDDRLEPFTTMIAWERLTAPLALVPFPPAVYEVQDPPPANPVAQLFANHDGQGEAVLAEVAFSFLLGVLDGDRRGSARWRDLLQVLYGLPPGVVEQAPGSFAWLVDLLLDQHRQLPAKLLAERNAITAGSHRLADRLIESGVPRLVEAGRRWAVFVAGHHAGAPPYEELPASLTAREFAPHEQALIDKYRAEIAELERTRGPLDPQLIFPVSNLSNFLSLCGDTLAAIELTERTLALGRATGQSAQFEVKLLERLARLNREAGRPDLAAAAQAEAEAIAGRN
ncbi:MAG: hypothetical protein AB7N76_24085 [Planctomycetota bacterium]